MRLVELLVRFNAIGIIEGAKSLLETEDPDTQDFGKAQGPGLPADRFLTLLMVDKSDADVLEGFSILETFLLVMVQGVLGVRGGYCDFKTQ